MKKDKPVAHKHVEHKPEVVTERVSREEMACVLRALVVGKATDGRGNVCEMRDNGVYCQFNRPTTDGSDHVFVLVPDTFNLEVFTPKE